ncbi:MAG: hypothetical protein R3B47_11265 [Bacteroidia bacterium]
MVGFDTLKTTVDIPRSTRIITVKLVLEERAIFTTEIELPVKGQENREKDRGHRESNG